MAREILTSLQSFAGDEVLIYADVSQHCVYNPLFDVAEHEKQRYENLKLELDLQ